MVNFFRFNIGITLMVSPTYIKNFHFEVHITQTPTKTRNKRATEGFAVVKSSFDLQKDFGDSMVEMVVDNNIRASRHLELFACYFSKI